MRDYWEKTTWMWLIATMTIACVATSAQAVDDLLLNITPPTTAVPGDLVSVTLEVANLTAPINGVQALLQYDTALLSLQSVVANDLGLVLPAVGWMEVALMDVAGDITYAAVINGSSVLANVTVATFTFQVLDEGITNFSFRPDADPFFNKLQLASDGTIVFPNKVDSGLLTTACDDGVFCNGLETLVGGVCQAGTPPDCSGLTNQCNVGVCNELAAACEAQPANENQACDDVDACTAGDVCLLGVCGGTAVDCSGTDDACNVGVCNPANGLCEPQPASEGLDCDDTDLCTTTDVCSSGVCGGTAVDCSGVDDACNVGTCNALSGLCEPQPANEGLDCIDGDLCTTTDICLAGVCGGTIVDCTSLDDACNVGVCDSFDGLCVAQATNEGGSCDDGLFCTGTETCSTGVCVSSGDPCAPLECDELNTTCLSPIHIANLEVYYAGQFSDAPDPTKRFLATGSTATLDQITSYTQGITGIRVIFDTTATFATTPMAAFSFDWTAGSGTLFDPVLDAANMITVTASDLTGVTVVDIVLANDHVRRRWLRVTIDSAQITAGGLALDGELSGNPIVFPSGDTFTGGNAVFYLGNVAGDVTGDRKTLLEDIGFIRGAVNPFLTVPISDIHDVNKDGKVLLGDVGEARLDVNPFFQLPLIAP